MISVENGYAHIGNKKINTLVNILGLLLLLVSEPNLGFIIILRITSITSAKISQFVVIWQLWL
jgi:hypothetical protein